MLTAKQKQVLDLVKKHNDDYGYSPTLKTIAEELGIKSQSTAHQHVKELVKKKYLVQDDDYAGLELPPKLQHNAKNVPILGYIAGGAPISVIEDTDPQTVTVAGLPSNGDYYALIVQGDSMVGDGIFDGDTVIIKKQSSAENGQ